MAAAESSIQPNWSCTAKYLHFHVGGNRFSPLSTLFGFIAMTGGGKVPGGDVTSPLAGILCERIITLFEMGQVSVLRN